MPIQDFKKLVQFKEILKVGGVRWGNMNGETDIARIEELRREVTENSALMRRVSELEEFARIGGEGYTPIEAVRGYRQWVDSFQALDKDSLTPNQNEAIEKFSRTLRNLEGEYRYLGAMPDQARIDAYLANRAQVLNTRGETFMISGYSPDELTGRPGHFTITRIRALSPSEGGGYSLTEYNAGAGSNLVGENELGQTRTEAVVERRIKPGVDPREIIRANISMRSSARESSTYALSKGYIEARLADEPPMRVIEAGAQTKGNCTTMSQRMMLQDVVDDQQLAGRVYAFMTDPNINPSHVNELLADKQAAIRAGVPEAVIAVNTTPGGWEPYQSSMGDQTFRYGQPFTDTAAMIDFELGMQERGIQIQWGKRDGKSYAYVVQSDQEGYNRIRNSLGITTNSINTEARLNVGFGLSAESEIKSIVSEAIDGLKSPNIMGIERDGATTKIRVSPDFSRSQLAALGIDSQSLGGLTRTNNGLYHTIEVPDETLPAHLRNEIARQQLIAEREITLRGGDEVTQLQQQRQQETGWKPQEQQQQQQKQKQEDGRLSPSGETPEQQRARQMKAQQRMRAENIAAEKAAATPAEPSTPVLDNTAKRKIEAPQIGGILPDDPAAREALLTQQRNGLEQARADAAPRIAAEARIRAALDADGPPRTYAEAVARTAEFERQMAAYDASVAESRAGMSPAQPQQAVTAERMPSAPTAQNDGIFRPGDAEKYTPDSARGKGGFASSNAQAGSLPDGGMKPANSHLTAAQLRIHSAVGAGIDDRIFDELERRLEAADGAAIEKPRAEKPRIEDPQAAEIAARAHGKGRSIHHGELAPDYRPPLLAEKDIGGKGNAKSGGLGTMSLGDAAEAAPSELRVDQGTVEQLRPTSQLRPEVAEVIPADRNASVDRVVNRDAGSVLPVAANDTGISTRSVNTTAPTSLATAANDAAPALAVQTTSDGATVTVDSAAVSAATLAAAAVAGSDGVRPVSEPHRAGGANRAMGGAGLAMSTQMIQAIQEKLARGEEVSAAEYIAAGVNVGYSALDTAGVTAIDDAAARTLGGLSPRLAKVGGPLVQAALAVPMIYAASETGDPKAIGAASFGAIGGIGAGMAGQALIPIPGVGFVVGVVAGEAAAHVGGLAADAMYNKDPEKQAAAVKELQQIQRDYIPNPLDPLRAPGATINLAGAAVSSVGRAVNTIGEVASWGGEQLNGLADSTQQSVSQGLGRYLPSGAANVIGTVAVTPMRLNAYTLQAAGAAVSAVGTGVDMLGQGVEAVGHTANRTADETKRVALAAATETVRVAGRAQEEFTQTFSREYGRDPTVRGAARATVVATADVAQRAGNYAVRKANEAYEAGSEMLSTAGSWLADRTPSWLGGNAGRGKEADDKPAARKAPAPAAAPKTHTISQKTLDELEAAGWGRKLGNGDNEITIAEVNAAFKKYGITARQADDNKDFKMSSQEISSALNDAIRARKAQGSGRS